MKKSIIIASFLFGLLSCANAQAVATLGADTIALGDQTTLTVRRALTYPSADQLSQDGIIALGQEFDSGAHTQTTVITSFEPGLHYVHLSPYDSLPLVVTDVEIDTANAELRDIAPLQRIPYTFWEIFRWVLLVWAVAIVAIVVWWLVERKRRHGSIIVHHEPQDTRTPEERALQTLDELRQRRLWQQGKQKEYHTELTDAVRRFIEEATGIRATELTSDETIEAVKYSTWNIDCTPLQDIFATADLVKFAKSEPQPHEHERSMDEAVRFVQQMWQEAKPKEEEVKHE